MNIPVSVAVRTRRRRGLRLAALLLAFTCSLAFAADPSWRDFYFEAITAEEGLAQNTITALLQDRTGFLWIGTPHGLQRYDGYEFTSFTSGANAEDTAPEGRISALAEDAEGNLWVGTHAFGLMRLAPDRAELRSIDRVRQDPIDALHVQALLFEPSRGLWIGGHSDVTLLDPQRDTELLTLPLRSQDNQPVDLRQLALAADGTLWLATSAGLWRLPPGSPALERVSAASLGDTQAILFDHAGRLLAAAGRQLLEVALDGSSLRAVEPARELPGDIRAMVEDGRGRLWLAVAGSGLARLDEGHRTLRWVRPQPDVPGGLPDASITGLAVDRTGLLWLSTAERGLLKVDPDGTPFRLLIDAQPGPGGTVAGYVRALLEDGDGSLWIGTQGKGLRHWLPAEGRFEDHAALLPAPGNEPHTQPAVTALALGSDGVLWVGTTQGAGRLDRATRELRLLPAAADTGTPIPAGVEVRSLLAARDGSLWLGTPGAGLYRYAPGSGAWQGYRSNHAAGAAHGLADNVVTALAEDQGGAIWAGGPTGLSRVDARTDTIESFAADAATDAARPLRAIRSLHVDAANHLWIGTGTGLLRLDAAAPAAVAQWDRWHAGDGLPRGPVQSVATDAWGRAWLGTHRGIAMFDPAAGEFLRFTMADGLQGMEFAAGASATLRDGDLLFGGSNGINRLSPGSLVEKAPLPTVAFTRAQLGNRIVRVPARDGTLAMNRSDHVLRLEFAALDYAAPRRNRYSYRLRGFDDNWVEAGTEHAATYTNLEAGRYRFEVRAASRDGRWTTEPTGLALEVLPPWWASTPARIGWGLALLGLLALAWQARQHRRRERQAHDRIVREHQERLRLALWGSGDDFWDWYPERDELVVTTADELVQEAIGDTGAVSFEWFVERVHPDDRKLLRERMREHMEGHTPKFELECRLRNRADRWSWLLLRGKVVERAGDGTPVRVCGTTRNVSKAHVAEQERRIAHGVFDSMAEAVAVTDLDFRFITVNPAFARITGWRQDEIVGQSFDLLKGAGQTGEPFASMRETLARSGYWRGELRMRRRDGEEFVSWAKFTDVYDATGMRVHFVAVLSDITDRKRTEMELRYLASYDVLTGLPNRTLLRRHIADAIVRARRNRRKVGLLFLDLDRFKHVNDSMGHAAGDRLLKAVGQRLRKLIRAGDSVARLGGDEFTLVVADIGDLAEAERTAQKVVNAFEQPVDLGDGREVAISPSIGISLYPDHGDTPDQLLKYADTAMYQAKDHGRRTWMVYTAAMDAAARLRATTFVGLRKALENDELSLVYQPKQALADGRITGLEALLRWRSADFGDVAPGVFIPLAEETGLILEIGNWVMQQACAQLAAWRRAGLGDIGISINVSVAQLLRGDLIRQLGEALAAQELPAARVELEVTESMVMANAERSIAILRQLKGIGVSIAIDDFGTGYSSLSYLRRLPIDTLKIDKEFVGDLTIDPDDDAITATIILMAHALDLRVIAEGVERAEQVERLREQDCDEIQGHWLSHPLPPERIPGFLREASRHAGITPGNPAA